MASISFAKRPRYVKWLGMLVFVCVYAALIAPLSIHSKRAPTVAHKATRLMTHGSLRPKPFVPLSEREQLVDAARWFGMGNEEELAFVADNFAATNLDFPKIDSLGEMRGVTISPRGEVRSVGTVNIARGRAYHYVLAGPGAEHIFIELEARKDGTLEFGFGPYRE